MQIRNQASGYLYNSRWILSVILISFNCLLPEFSYSHADLEEQIYHVTLNINKSPDNPQLYYQRGELYRLHGDRDNAMVDYEKVLELKPDYYEIWLAKGQMFYGGGWPNSAKFMLNKYLKINPEHPEALLTRARVHVQLKEYPAAGDDYTQAIKILSEPKPDYYIERAECYIAQGENYLPAALRGIEEGIQKLGTVITLQLTAVEIEIKMKKYDEAVARLDKIMEPLPRKEFHLIRKGEILEMADRTDDAINIYQSALKSIQESPEKYRNTDLSKEMEDRINKHLMELSDLSNDRKSIHSTNN